MLEQVRRLRLHPYADVELFCNNHSIVTADVAVKTLTATASAANKVYDGKRQQPQL